MKILQAAGVCGGWSGMKTSSWEGNLNVMLNTFKYYSNDGKVQFYDFGDYWESVAKIHISCFMESRAEMQLYVLILRGLKAERPIWWV